MRHIAGWVPYVCDQGRPKYGYNGRDEAEPLPQIIIYIVAKINRAITEV